MVFPNPFQPKLSFILQKAFGKLKQIIYSRQVWLFIKVLINFHASFSGLKMELSCHTIFIVQLTLQSWLALWLLAVHYSLYTSIE